MGLPDTARVGLAAGSRNAKANGSSTRNASLPTGHPFQHTP
jgi:hypothetical protein